MSAKLTLTVTAAALAVAVSGCTILDSPEGATPTSSTSGLSATMAVTAAPPLLPAAAPVAVTPATVTENQAMVSKVIDGDTFDIVGGPRVRLLGIDSCEMDTKGGELAKAEAERLLGGRTVTLNAEPTGDDIDPDGRLLRYVSVDGQDFGTQMVEWDHTGIYDGVRDASQAYVTTLYQHDTVHASRPPSGRECGGPVIAAAPRTNANPAPRSNPPAAPAEDKNSAPRPEKKGGGSVHYKNCDDVRAHGAAPIRPGDPGWQSKFDRNNDGVGCE